MNALVACSLTVLMGLSPLADEVKEPRCLLTWGQKGDKAGEFYSPIHIAINKHDEIYVADLNNSRVQKFTTDGVYLSEFPLPMDVPPRRSCIIGGMVVDEEGLIYLSFMNQNKLSVYKDDGTVVREWGKKGAGDGEFHQPGGIVLRKDGTLLVADQCNHRVQTFTRDGTYLTQWGEFGSNPGQFGGPEMKGSRFGGPHFLSQDSHGRLYTTEGVMGRIQQFSPNGKPLAAWGDKGDEPGGFGSLDTGFSKGTFGPIGVKVDPYDRVWVSSLNDRVQCFTPDGRFLFNLAPPGKAPGHLYRPHGMAFDSKGFLYVADASNQRIQKFQVPAP